LFFVVAFAIGLALHDWHPWFLALPAGGRSVPFWAGIALLACGFAIFWWGMATFARARTGIMLERPAEGLVTHGPYRWSRNPMYVGYSVAYGGFAALFNSLWPLLTLPLALVVLYGVIVRREEQYLQSVFRDRYEAYCRRVRRWV
jgi:protein-S-isoprenylcysteine O-methyltransferase Ste14